MKRTITCLMIVLFCAISTFAQAKRAKRFPTPDAGGGKCAVTVRNDLLPNRGVVVVGCDSFGNAKTFIAVDGTQQYGPSTGGIIVFDSEMNVIFRWTACTACGGFFSGFAGTKKVQGHNALLITLVGGPRRDDGRPTPPLMLPLYFNGREFKLDRYSTNNVLP
jgi:hypothetical protein